MLSEALTHREEIPTSLRIHVPHVCLLARIFSVRLVDQMHEEKPGRKVTRPLMRDDVREGKKKIMETRDSHVISEIVFLGDVSVESMWDFVKIVLADATDEAI